MKKAQKDKPTILSKNKFPVVGIGASAGGLDAFKKLLKAIPEDSGMAYILVQHLDPAHESILADLLQRVTKIPVQEITDNIHVLPDHIYIIPSNKLLTATDGVLQLSARLPKTQRNLPIDVLFYSLAEVHQNHAIGIVLSGTATDGTLGLKAIKDHGGITFAQDPASAAYVGMPQSAIDAGVVDFVLPPEKIPRQLLLLNAGFKSGPSTGEKDSEQIEESEYKQIISLIRVSTGVDFTYYKQATIRRRINRRMALCMKKGIGEYISYLKDSKIEQSILYQDLLIPVTQFFRDPKMFDSLGETIFPALLKNREGNNTIRLWVAGCSTGEEAYSMVICFQEFQANKASNIKLQVFATDISEMAIAKARGGIYGASEINGLPPGYLEKYFTKVDGKFRLSKIVRDACIFAHHNYIKDPPFANIDLISCRNSLIYLEPFLQKRALTTFHYSLREKGVLILGKSETVGQGSEFFNVLDKSNKFFSRKPTKGNFLHLLVGRENEVNGRESKRVIADEINKDDYQKSGDDLLLSKYVPPGVIINEEMEIVQFRGATGMWLEQSHGKPNSNLLKMARESISFELRSLFHKTKKAQEPQTKENIPLQFAGKDRLVTIEIVPLPNTIEHYFLVLFKDTTLPMGISEELDRGSGHPDDLKLKINKEKVRSNRLQKELAQTREDMRSVTEDQEAVNEELQSANEELLSGSEELQSLNEELETSKEEVQTSNEELIIVNQELFDRNEQLNLARLYAESIISTMREPLVILNAEMKVKSANRAFYSKFQVKEEETEGKLLFELGSGQWEIPDLKRLLEVVLPKKINIIDFEVATSFPGLGNRVMLLNATPIVRDQSEELAILIAVEDITEKREKEQIEKVMGAELEKKIFDRTFQLHEASTELQLSHENLDQFTYVASHDLQEPLRKIRTFSNILHDKYYNDLSTPVKGLVSKIRVSSERMSILIKELLNFSKVLHGDEVFEQVDLDKILDDVINDLDLVIVEKKVVIERERLPIIDAVPFQINQLFYNLIENSIKFSKSRVTPVITITSKILKLEEAAKYVNINPKLSYCEISIKDNGIGFNQKMDGEIFLLFTRLNRPGKYYGTGIGLALCKKIVSNHHGEITAKSKENEGALFKIVIPLAR
jgi:two-component system CheB/CheR fusion protein